MSVLCLKEIRLKIVNCLESSVRRLPLPLALLLLAGNWFPASPNEAHQWKKDE